MIRAGVIGLGWAGQQHMNGYARAEGTELVSIAGMEAGSLQRLGDEHEVDLAHRFVDWHELVSSGTVDVVSIATPTTLHAPIAVAALDAGLHVLSEKPMAETGAVARTMVEAAERNDRVLDVSFNHRRRGVAKAMRGLVEAGTLGELYYVKTGWLRRQGIPGLGTWFTQHATAGGGALMDIGVHMLDMALHVMGEPTVSSVSAATYAHFGPVGRGGSSYGPRPDAGDAFDVEDLATAFLRLSGGQTLLLETSWAQWIADDSRYLTVYGSEGGAHLWWDETGNRDLKVWSEVDGMPAELMPAVPTDGGHDECVSDFMAKVLSGDFTRHRGHEALRRAEIVTACYDAAAAGAEVRLG